MYLLKLIGVKDVIDECMNSHSTMYLLKLSADMGCLPHQSKFTFHHVSIKTLPILPNINLQITFTFHHVSIKTYEG